ncbi:MULTISPECIES: ABC transporter ATP-binding protein [Paenibacillus sonchi group]|uniref:Sodium ABC transporter ATP-binding protein n=1 Tax=Paenibacillus riograndensis TaxID=483937 RepID=A0A132U8Y3_9BACL|nr:MULTISPECIES: ABC transporter ATP-binding protein [Paenibacillus sonchi group]KWX80099.1 sodium ABC transporter ATP-binding protein [Paenibacillus riograndensis]KWX84791.1 sodium ABC transporter ATP-binding protein [Paenibacillus riograndensis]MCE3201175.1 ABC transporter ATP-binding protein [Paenibacillus sonchi]
MSDVIKLQGLSKSYDRFELRDISLGIKEGYITGLIGPNGAGKTSLIKMIMGMVYPDQGEIQLFGQNHLQHQAANKDRIGYVSDENIYYENLTVKDMKRVTAPFYTRWDENTYLKYQEKFKLPPGKKIKDLSKGMKIKFSLAVALSHGADLLIMDEPTSGLDPIFRRELLELLSEHIQDEKKSIVFSTHNTADLDRIADYIVFINEGRLVFNEMRETLTEKYLLVKGGKELLDRDVRRWFIGLRESGVGFEGLIGNRVEGERYFKDTAICETPTLEEIMYFTVKGSEAHV